MIPWLLITRCAEAFLLGAALLGAWAICWHQRVMERRLDDAGLRERQTERQPDRKGGAHD